MQFPSYHWSKYVMWGFISPCCFYAFGAWLERKEDLRMTKFRDKSALFGKELKPGQPPSWP